MSRMEAFLLSNLNRPKLHQAETRAFDTLPLRVAGLKASPTLNTMMLEGWRLPRLWLEHPPPA